MNKRITAICLTVLLCTATTVRAQWVTFDPSNLAQSIVNTTRNVIQTTTTAENMVKNFQETVKIYEQGKKYYDALIHDGRTGRHRLRLHEDAGGKQRDA